MVFFLHLKPPTKEVSMVVSRISDRAQYQPRQPPIEWLPATSALRRAAFNPLTRPDVSQVGSIEGAFIAVASYTVMAEAWMWMRYVLDTLECSVGDEQRFGRVVDRAGHFFVLDGLESGQLPKLVPPPQTLALSHYHCRLALRDEWSLLPPLFKNALADLAELVIVWLDRHQRSLRQPRRRSPKPSGS